MKKYSLASSTWDDKEIRAMEKVIKLNNFTMGKNVKKFEENFSNFIGSKYTVMVSSGSSANLLSVASLFYTKKPKLKAGDEIIVPAVSWSTTYFPLYQYGLKLKFVDIDLKTLNYDLDALKRSITKKTKMILAVNLLGNPNKFDEIKKIIGKKDIILFEDNCESLGATYKNKYAGTFGLLGTFSTFFSHHISTMEGGLITTNDEELYNILLSLRAHGWTRDLPNKNKITKKSTDSFSESFRFILPGYNSRPLEFSGAIGIEQLKKLPSLLRARKKNASIFQNTFNEHPDYIIQENTCNSSWFGFSLIIKSSSSKDRSKIIKELTNNNIECRPIVSGNFTKNEVIKYFDYEIFETLPNADCVHDNGFFVGNHHYDISSNIKRLYDVLS